MWSLNSFEKLYIHQAAHIPMNLYYRNYHGKTLWLSYKLYQGLMGMHSLLYSWGASIEYQIYIVLWPPLHVTLQTLVTQKHVFYVFTHQSNDYNYVALLKNQFEKPYWNLPLDPPLIMFTQPIVKFYTNSWNNNIEPVKVVLSIRSP